MSQLLVSPLSGVAQALQNHRPSHLVSLLSPLHMIPTPKGYDRRTHLQLAIDDVSDPLAADFPPAREHVERLIAFAREWDANAPLLIHCWAGISRSMASAFAILCDRLGPGREIEVAMAMRRRAPHANPNLLLVRHADEALSRDGRMVAALRTMGPPLPVMEGATTAFPLANL
ncbi:MAG: tyrosine phosphatase family protein [Rhizomicrobium sp.]